MPSGSAALLLLLGLGRLLDRDLEETPLVTSLAEVLEDATPTQVLEQREWVRHRVRPRERTGQIAARYGVRRDKLVQWNRLDAELPRPKGRKTLKVLARRIPPPRVKVRYRVIGDEGWGDVAAKFRVENLDIRAWNWRKRRLRHGTELTLWVDPGRPWTIVRGHSAAVQDKFDLRVDAQSVGRPNRGKLIRGLKLPDSDLYSKGGTAALWGSSHAILQVMRAFSAFRRDTGYEGEVIVGSISRKYGRKFFPHRSHQSGRDIDIRLPLLPGVPKTANPNPDEVDWYATWGLVRGFVDGGETAMIFLNIDLHRRLYEAARIMGEPHEVLKKIIAWPNWYVRWPIVRHADGHDGHIHVRIKCGPAEPRCKSK